MTDDDQPYENTLDVEDLRREVRRLWNTQNDLVRAIRDKADVPSWDVLMLLSRAARWPEDNTLGKKLRNELAKTIGRQAAVDKIYYKSELEAGAGLWSRIREGLQSGEAME